MVRAPREYFGFEFMTDCCLEHRLGHPVPTLAEYEASGEKYQDIACQCLTCTRDESEY